jgi:hypothetical protein
VLVLAATLFADDLATFGVHVSAWLGVAGWWSRWLRQVACQLLMSEGFLEGSTG